VDEDASNHAMNFLSQKRQDNAIVTTKREITYSFEGLGEKQRISYNTILEHYRGGGCIESFRMIIQGTVDTGMSYLIVAIKYAMEIDSLPNKSSLLLLAPTGVATFNISASTKSSTFCILVRDMNYLQGLCLITLQGEIKHTKYILIDEMIFIGKKLLKSIDARLRQDFPEHSTIFFGGRSVILVGDLGQLPPVMDKPAYACDGPVK